MLTMKRSNAPTLTDIAREAGCTPMAASVVLNNATSSTRVSAATRTRILDAAARLHYRPNKAAQGLLNRRMNAIGVVCWLDKGDVNVYFMEVFNGILAAAVRNQQNTTVYSVSNWADQDGLIQFFDGRVDGMILLAPFNLDKPLIERLQHHTPIVMIHGSGSIPETWNLDVDDEDGAKQAVGHLLDLGHTKIVHFAGPDHLLGARRRAAGFMAALKSRSIVPHPSMIYYGEFTTNSGRERVASMIDTLSPEELPTAIFCGNDAIAFGCMEVLAERGIKVPDGISLVGFDDSLVARMTYPPLTTVRQPLTTMGEHAVELLLAMLDSSYQPTCAEEIPGFSGTASEVKPVHLIYPTNLVNRGSTTIPR